MDKIFSSNKIYVASSTIPDAGRGIFAQQLIVQGETIEVCPVIGVPLGDASNSDSAVVPDYFFYFGDDLAIALGFGSLYNHSYEPNATYVKKFSEGMIEFTALRDIESDEEITVSYNNGDPADKSKPMNSGLPSFEE